MKKSTIIKAALVAAKTAVVVARTASRKMLNSTEPNANAPVTEYVSGNGENVTIHLGGINEDTFAPTFDYVNGVYAKDAIVTDRIDLVASLASIAFDAYSIKDEKDTRKRNIKYAGLTGVGATMLAVNLVMNNLNPGRMAKYFAYNNLTLEQSRFLAYAKFFGNRYDLYSYTTQAVNVLGVVAASIIVGL